MAILVMVIMINPRRMEIHGSAGRLPDFLAVFSFLVLATIFSGKDLDKERRGGFSTPPFVESYVLINPLKGFGNSFLPAFVLLIT